MPDVLGDNFVEGSFDGAVLLATATLLGGHLRALLCLRHESSAQDFIILVEFGVWEENRPKLIHSKRRSSLGDQNAGASLPAQRRVPGGAWEIGHGGVKRSEQRVVGSGNEVGEKNLLTLSLSCCGSSHTVAIPSRDGCDGS